MITRKVITVVASLFLVSAMTFAQQDMNKEQWQQEVERFTRLRNEEKVKLQDLTNQVNALQAQSAKLDADIVKCMDELYALVGATKESAMQYQTDLAAAEQLADELLRLSDADLVARKSDVSDLEARTKRLRENKLSLIPDFSARVDALEQKVASLQKALAAHGGGSDQYVVGRGDCLWNISRKSEVYSNARLWPKLWMNNKIKNPDLIYPGQNLSVPAGNSLTPKEKAAAKRYYQKKNNGGQ